uniref:Uncharacterized protein n=1 Tax=Oryza sativa subsp. japonica TaxID=39947 RepID=Q65X40_ORYSJ|nr:hypothetical protein [Oryza sativa Japonica Group]AAU44008.1 hypothetical protein [Oryza sativa Japonica Group]
MADGGAHPCAAAASRAARRESKRGGRRPGEWIGEVEGAPRKVMASGFEERETDGGAQPGAASTKLAAAARASSAKRRWRELHDAEKERGCQGEGGAEELTVERGTASPDFGDGKGRKADGGAWTSSGARRRTRRRGGMVPPRARRGRGRRRAGTASLVAAVAFLAVTTKEAAVLWVGRATATGVEGGGGSTPFQGARGEGGKDCGHGAKRRSAGDSGGFVGGAKAATAWMHWAAKAVDRAVGIGPRARASAVKVGAASWHGRGGGVGATGRKGGVSGTLCPLPHQDKGESEAALPAREKAKGGGGKGALLLPFLGGEAGEARGIGVAALAACGMRRRGHGDAADDSEKGGGLVWRRARTKAVDAAGVTVARPQRSAMSGAARGSGNGGDEIQIADGRRKSKAASGERDGEARVREREERGRCPRCVSRAAHVEGVSRRECWAGEGEISPKPQGGRVDFLQEISLRSILRI